MKSMIHFAAIDIGSNAARLLISSVKGLAKKEIPSETLLVRVPLRLGEDVFLNGEIGKEKEKNVISLLKSYQYLLKIYRPVSIRACATSAMREASNGKNIVKKISESTGIDVEIIKGKKEAQIIYDSHVADILDPRCDYIYVDVGGGSTEITLIKNRKFVESKSFNIGTLRMLAKKVNKEHFEEMAEWLKKIHQRESYLEIIGSGGNINKLYRLAKLREGEKLSVKRLDELHRDLKKYSMEVRMDKFKMRTDRADVIIPASEIFLKIAKTANVSKINVPTMGLADGIIHLLYEDYLRKRKS